MTRRQFIRQVACALGAATLASLPIAAAARLPAVSQAEWRIVKQEWRKVADLPNGNQAFVMTHDDGAAVMSKQSKHERAIREELESARRERDEAAGELQIHQAAVDALERAISRAEADKTGDGE